ncbi:MAG TPA: hypothetical protein VGM90_34305 [Kofleriaceae bacterium]|jgi:hypothetical protein
MAVARRPQPRDVSTETIETELRLRTPYRGIETGKPTLRLKVRVPLHAENVAVTIDVDDHAIEVHWRETGFSLGAGAIDALFVVETQPRTGFLTWFGVFVRSKGRPDRVLLQTPDCKVARFVERMIEEWLGLDDQPIRGECRID